MTTDKKNQFRINGVVVHSSSEISTFFRTFEIKNGSETISADDFLSKWNECIAMLINIDVPQLIRKKYNLLKQKKN